MKPKEYLLVICEAVKREIKELRKKDENLLNHNFDTYEALSPKDDIEKMEYYNEVLDFAMKNSEIKNIALTGPYGSGKSSIIKTYKKNNSKNKFLLISLASFKKNIDEEEEIEKSILQQILYKECSEKTPFSRFRRISNSLSKDINILSIVLFLLFFSVNIIYFGNNIFNFFLEPPLLNDVVLVVFLISLFFLIKKIVLFSYLKIQSLKVMNCEIEISKDSILSKYLDEIIYFFSRTEYDIVVFEDLDRFDDIEDVFSKLREINYILNNSKEINSRSIKFIYAIKDDLFTNNEKMNRTKFFDFIIPVIPVIGSSNSAQRMIDKFQYAPIRPSDKVIKSLLIYVGDMRTINNISNEFLLYSKNLKIKKEDESIIDKLFAIIVFKNIYPTLFAEMQNNKGVVRKIFKNKEEYLGKKQKEIEEERNKLENLIDRANRESISSIRELRIVFLAREILDNDNFNLRLINIHSGNQSIDNFLTKDEFWQNDNLETEIIFNYNNGIPQKKIYKKDFLKINELENSYFEREKAINLKKIKELDKIKNRIKKLEEDIEVLKMTPLSRILQNDRNFLIEKPKDSEQLENWDMVVYLLRESYIDESFDEYISFFYPGIITKEDNWFIRSVRNRKELSFDYKLSNPNDLIEMLNITDYEHESILNYSLVDAILFEHKDKSKRKPIIKLLANKNKRCVDFIIKYSNRIDKNKQSLFFELLCDEWDDIWLYFLNESNLPNDILDHISLVLFNVLNIEMLLRINKEGLFSIYFSKQQKLNDIEDENYIDKLINLDVKFDNIPDDKKIKKEIIESLYENECYKINKNNVSYFIEYHGKGRGQTYLSNINYSSIMEMQATPLANYINKNLSEYITNVYLKINGEPGDSEQIIYKLINNKDLSNTLKVEIIEKNNVSISNLFSIEDKKLWRLFLTEKLININWKNLICFFEYGSETEEEKEFLDIIIDLASNEKNRVKLIEDARFNQDKIEKLVYKVINESNKYEFNKIELFLHVLKTINIQKFTISEISDVIMNYLVTKNKIEFTLENASVIKKESNRTIYIKYLCSNFKDVVARLADINIIEEEFIGMVEQGILNTKNKNELMDIAFNYKRIDISKLMNLLIYSSVELNIKIEFLIKRIQKIEKSEILSLLGLLEKKEKSLTIQGSIIEEGKKTVWENNNLNIKLLNLLKEKKIVSSLKQAGNIINVYNKKKF